MTEPDIPLDLEFEAKERESSSSEGEESDDDHGEVGEMGMEVDGEVSILAIAISRYPAISAIDSKNLLPSTRMCWERYFRCWRDLTAEQAEPCFLVCLQ